MNVRTDVVRWRCSMSCDDNADMVKMQQERKAIWDYQRIAHSTVEAHKQQKLSRHELQWTPRTCDISNYIKFQSMTLCWLNLRMHHHNRAVWSSGTLSNWVGPIRKWNRHGCVSVFFCVMRFCCATAHGPSLDFEFKLFVIEFKSKWIWQKFSRRTR